MEIQAYAVKDISPSNTVDIATIKLDGKRLTMKLQDRVGAYPGVFVIDTLWMGHGHTKLEIPYDAFTPPHLLEVYALSIETIPNPAGDQIMLSVSYRVHSGSGTSYEQTTWPWDLRMFLDEAFAPSP